MLDVVVGVVVVVVIDVVDILGPIKLTLPNLKCRSVIVKILLFFVFAKLTPSPSLCVHVYASCARMWKILLTTSASLFDLRWFR